MKKICPLCDHIEAVQIFSSSIADVYKCQQCKGLFSEPKVNTDELYNGQYFKSKYVSIAEQQAEKFAQYVQLIQKYKDRGSFLDYGCGVGVFLKVVNEHGYINNVGVDVSKQALMLAKYNVSEKDRLLNPGEEIDRKFDVISFIDSIAHIPNVQSMLKKLISNNLDDDGVLFVRTPNINKLYVVYANLLSLVLPKIYKNSAYFLPYRYLLFNKSAMNYFLDTLGMEAVYVAFQKDYSRKVKLFSIKQYIGYLLFQTIPSFLNPLNSIIVIARRK